MATNGETKENGNTEGTELDNFTLTDGKPKNMIVKATQKNGADQPEHEPFINKATIEVFTEASKVDLGSRVKPPSERFSGCPELPSRYIGNFKDVEALPEDYFERRELKNPTSNNETLTHLLKASLGSGILTMHVAFMSSGLIAGIFFTIIVAAVCTHCSYILVKCSHVLYKRTNKYTMTFSDVAEAAFETGPQWSRKWTSTFRNLIPISLFAAYFGTCSVYTVIIAKNINPVIKIYAGEAVDPRIIIGILLPFLLVMSWIPNLKYLAPVSMIANIFMAVGLGITFYYLITGDNHWGHLIYMNDFREWPKFASVTIFAMEAIGVVMPLENAMKTPQRMLGFCGVLNLGMTGVTFVYIIVGFLGYVKFGANCSNTINSNLDANLVPVQIIDIAIALAVYCTFGLQFFVCLDISYNGIKDKFKKRPILADYIMRTILTIACVCLAIAVPTITPFIGLIGAFCFSILGLIIPCIIEIVTYWDIGFGKYNYLMWKDIILLVFGFLALIFGTLTSIEDIIQHYQQQETST